MKKRVLFVFGTRPETIKMAPVIRLMRQHADSFEPVICVTAQHRQMLDQFLNVFDITPDIDLNLMEDDQSLDSFANKALTALSETYSKIHPDIVLVQGDTTTAMIACLAAYYQKISVGHVEAGLRTHNKYNPFPEEINRQIIGRIADYHFAPTQRAYDTLIREGTAATAVVLTGNTVVDALQYIRKNIERFPTKIDGLSLTNKRLILVTSHRRENFGEPLQNICAAILKIIRTHEDVEIVYPVHLNPNVQRTVHDLLAGQDRIQLIKPVEYFDLIRLLDKAYLVLTDSGGIQEEAPALAKPVLVLRKETERPEGIEAGVAKLVGTSPESIFSTVETLLNNASEYSRMAQAVSPYGDGTAAQKIIAALRQR